MDTKRLMILMLVSLAILIGWQQLMNQIAKKNNWRTGPETPAHTTAAAPSAAAAPSGEPATAETAGSPAVGTRPATPARMRVLTQAEPTTLTLGSSQMKDEVWAMGLETSSQGASVASVTLNAFPRSDEHRKEPYVFQTRPKSGRASMETAWAKVNGQSVDLSGAVWEVLEKSADGSSVSFALTIGQEKPFVRLVKTFSLHKRDNADAGYEIQIRHRVENISGEPVQVQLGLSGPTTPPREMERGPDLFAYAGYNKNPAYPLIEATVHGVETLTGEKASTEIVRGEKDRPLIWAGLGSTYFDALVLPVGSKNISTAEFIEGVKLTAVGSSVAGAKPVGAELMFTTKTLPLGQGASSEFDLMTFFGPKARSIIKNDYYGQYPREYQSTLTTGSSCICTVQQLVDVTVALLRGLHFVLRDWGLAIIGLVIFVRSLMHPLTRKSTISMHKMSKLAPEIERIKKKYADDPQEQQRAMMAFYKEHGAGQVLGCLPMFIQMPIWVALWSSLQSTFELRLAPFLFGFTWIDDLAKPDRLIPLPHIDLWLFSIDAVNLLPILMGVFFFLQQKYTPKPASTTPEQAQQQKMMQWMMVLMFPLMLYNGPSGLNLYIFTSTAVGMLESKWIRDHIKAREEAIAAGKIMDVAVPKKKSRLGAWLSNRLEQAQKMAAEAQKSQKKRK